jgi:putative ABC transport system substrate-binding protein
MGDLDPVKSGLVASMNRPGGNITGMTNLSSALSPKRVELLHETLPNVSVLGMLVNPDNPEAETETRDAQAAARALGLEFQILNARTGQEIDTAFAAFVERRIGALIVGADAAFTSGRGQFIALASRHRLPAIYSPRDFPLAGGLMSYGANLTELYRLVGVYTGRILAGEKPADLPILQPTKFDLVINLFTAKALGLDIPPKVLALADEVIE